ncbi:hypothetical protein DSO57_1023496 [Entomophthora muscae]|uniref:Uncharacterized protein n=1 Tax=Entomophthora muscae TaxID=34485 RepID=A0ACC2U0Q5_9FUNG|nr:hypothetical protein DSO57_1023496 [Entomophthora muscae]
MDWWVLDCPGGFDPPSGNWGSTLGLSIQSPAPSTEGEETDGSLTDHSFYNLDSDEEPTKRRCQAKKTPSKDKSPAHEEHQYKPPSASPTKLASSSSPVDDTKPYVVFGYRGQHPGGYSRKSLLQKI